MKLHRLIAFLALVAFAPVGAAQGQIGVIIILHADFAIVDATGQRFDVAIRYVGTAEEGETLATYTDAAGNVLRDEAKECRLVMDARATSLACRNPHFRTWDNIYYMESSDAFTDGKLETFDIVDNVHLTVQYRRRKSDG